MDLKMEVYTPLLELTGVLEAHRSVIWENKAFGAGSFSVESLITQETKTLLVPDNIIWIEGNTAGIIGYFDGEHSAPGAYITVKGDLLTGILKQRILWGQYNLTGTPPQIMHSLVSDCCISPTRGDVESRKIPGLVSLTPAAGGASIRVQKTGGTLLEALEEIGAAYGVAFGVRFNPAVPQMEFWTRWGQNRSVNQDANDPVFYSTELDDVLSSEYSYNSQDWRNVALVAGEGEGNNRTMIVVESDIAPAPTPPTPPEPAAKYTVTLSITPDGGGTVTGAGEYEEGKQATVSAAPNEGYRFVHWIDGTAPPEPTTITINVSDSLNQAATMISSVGVLTVAGAKITSVTNEVQATGSTATIIYCLSRQISKKRSVSVNGNVIGTVSNVNDSVSTSVQLQDNNVINIHFEYVT